MGTLTRRSLFSILAGGIAAMLGSPSAGRTAYIVNAPDMLFIPTGPDIVMDEALDVELFASFPGAPRLWAAERIDYVRTIQDIK